MQIAKHVVAAAFAFSSMAFAADYDIDSSHTSATFSVKHLMVTNVKGHFEKVSGTVSLDDKDLTKSKVNLTIDPSTINTREPKRDEHLKSPDFFDVAKFKEITFKSTKIEKAGEGFKVTGDLTMHGVTKSVTLDATAPSAAIKSPFGTTVRAVSVTGKLNRKDFGLNWNKALETGGVVVGEEVDVAVDAELVEKAPGKPAAAAPAKK